MKQVIAIAGSSSRLSELAAQELAKAGHVVYMDLSKSGRRSRARIKSLKRFATQNSLDIRILQFDGTSKASAESGVQQIVRECGRLDVLIQITGPVSSSEKVCTPEQLTKVCETYLLSAQRLNRAALPAFRKRGHGLLMWVTGSGEYNGSTNDFAPYIAAKAVLESFAGRCAEDFAGLNIESTMLIAGESNPAWAIVEVIEMPVGTRPMLVNIDSAQAGLETCKDNIGRLYATGSGNKRLRDLLHTHLPQIIDIYS